MRSNYEMVKAVADLRTVSGAEIAHMKDVGLIYTDGYAWQLTEAGRKVLKDGTVTWLDVPAATTASTCHNDPAVQNLIDTIRANPLVFVADSDTSAIVPKSAKDTQIGGDHYKKLGHHQPWEVLATWMTAEELRGYMKGTVIGYLAREQDKGGDADIKKACHTMQLWEEVRKDKP